jgi:hypothetical protein
MTAQQANCKRIDDSTTFKFKDWRGKLNSNGGEEKGMAFICFVIQLAKCHLAAHLTHISTLQKKKLHSSVFLPSRHITANP